MEFVVERGHGYVPTEAREETDVEVGAISIDAVYSPVVRVGYTIENVRVGKMTNYEKLMLDVQTDGTIQVEDAVMESAQILLDQFSVFVNPPQEEEEESEVDENIEKLEEEVDAMEEESKDEHEEASKEPEDQEETEEEKAIKKKYESFKSIELKDVPEELFPIPIKKLLKGLKEGRKRGLFVLLTFLRSLNFSPEYINSKVREWNKLNDPPLKEGYVKSQVDWHLKQKKKILPPNYSNDNFYKDLKLLDSPSRFKNPIAEVARRVRKNS